MKRITYLCAMYSYYFKNISKICFQICIYLFLINLELTGQIPLPVKQSVRELNNLKNEAEKRGGINNSIFDTKISNLFPKKLNENILFIDFLKVNEQKKLIKKTKSFLPNSTLRLHIPIEDDKENIKKSWLYHLQMKYNILPEKRQDSLLVFLDVKMKSTDSESLNLYTYLNTEEGYSIINLFIKDSKKKLIPIEDLSDNKIIFQLLYQFGLNYYRNKLTIAKKKEERKQNILKNKLSIHNNRIIDEKEKLFTIKNLIKDVQIRISSLEKNRQLTTENILTLNKFYAQINSIDKKNIKEKKKELDLLREKLEKTIYAHKLANKNYINWTIDVKTAEKEYEATIILLKELRKEIQLRQIIINFFSQQINNLNKNKYL